VLVLTASYGSGHNRVAETVAEALGRAGATATVLDHFRDLVHPTFDRVSRSFYYGLLRRAPMAWGAAYWLGDQLSVSSPLLLGLNRVGMRKLAARLAADGYDHVVTVHPTPAVALAELRARGYPVPAHTTVFTDFVAHAQWMPGHVDRYCVPAEEIARDLTARGVPRDRVVVTGVPVGEEFRRPRERAAARLALGLSARLPVLLVMAGSVGGFGRLEDATRKLLEMEDPLQAVVVAGREQALETRLAALAAGSGGRVKVVGFVDHVRELMAAADLLVSKAGGLTVAEALAAELPILCWGSLPGQETRNERWAAMAGIGLVARSDAQLHRVIAAALRDPGLLRHMRDRIRLYRRPDAAETVAALVLERGERARRHAS
jgi:processive 1,2-diacylglycerol beta-glucosyltransferase